MKKVCKECGKEFETNNIRVTICSDECNKNRKLRTDRERYRGIKCICKICNEEFIGNKGNKYCSDKCKSEGLKTNKKHFIHNCVVCGKEFKDKAHQSKYCSEECKNKARPKHKKELRQHKCIECGKKFESTQKSSRYCSSKCATQKEIQKTIDINNKWLKEHNFKQYIVGYNGEKNKKYIVKCLKCNKTRELTAGYLRSVRSNRKKYLGCPNCNKENFKQARINRIRVAQTKMNQCKICNKHTKEELTNGLCKKCNDKIDNTYKCIMCGNEFYSKDKSYLCNVCKTKEKEINKIQSKRLKYTIIHRCQYCGEIFHISDKWKGKKYCSVECRNKKENKRKEIRRRTRLITNGKYDDTITLKKLYKKYNGVCQICGKKCDYEDYVITEKGVHIAGNMYPSIDHMIPLAKGGTHTDNNVQLAHRICNSIKSSNIVEEIDGQMRFF